VVLPLVFEFPIPASSRPAHLPDGGREWIIRLADIDEHPWRPMSSHTEITIQAQTHKRLTSQLTAVLPEPTALSSYQRWSIFLRRQRPALLS